jgi:UDP-N-acetylmuramoyl-tripeptide--D-alanyl-D-alanine ligase
VLPAAASLLDPHRRADLDEWRFGLDTDADVYPLLWRPGVGPTEAVFCVRGERVAFATNLRLAHHRLTLAAALAAYASLGLPLDRAGEATEAIDLSPWRGQEQPLPDGAVLINDAYNANPLSLATALDALAARRDGGRAVAVLGAMAELGPTSQRLHAEAGRHAAKLGIDPLIAVGPGARAYLDGAAGQTGCRWYPEPHSAAHDLAALLRPRDVVLLKGSRTAALEQLAQTLAQ